MRDRALEKDPAGEAIAAVRIRLDTGVGTAILEQERVGMSIALQCSTG